jgi:hypothetical protein
MNEIYFARIAGTEGPIKIGCSLYPKGRCKQLSCDLSAKVEVIAAAPGDFLLERNLHLKFAKYRVSDPPTREGRKKPAAGASEWFEPCAQLLELIETVKRTGKIELSLEECRERAIAARYKGGESLKQIGDSYGITRERVRQILDSIGVPRRSAAERSYLLKLEREAKWRAWEERRAAWKANAA